jgi:outer membrane protein assembly factor BamB
VWKWRLKSNYPIIGAVTPTAGGLVFAGGNLYALDAATGQKLWGRKIGGAIGGGVSAARRSLPCRLAETEGRGGAESRK